MSKATAIACMGLVGVMAASTSTAAPERRSAQATRCIFPTYKGKQYRKHVLRTTRVEVGERVGTAVLYQLDGTGCRAVRRPVYRIKGIPTTRALSRESSRREILIRRLVCYPHRGGDLWLVACLRGNNRP
jgi:hypothetical protein